MFGSPFQLILGSAPLGFLPCPAHPLRVQVPDHHHWEHTHPQQSPAEIFVTVLLSAKGCWQ